jgi:hypothetical protein
MCKCADVQILINGQLSAFAHFYLYRRSAFKPKDLIFIYDPDIRKFFEFAHLHICTSAHLHIGHIDFRLFSPIFALP